MQKSSPLQNKLRSALGLLAWVGAAELTGVVGSFFTTSAISTWYADLAKPVFNPPNWVFGPVWTTLYALMGVAAFLIWRKGTSRPEVKTALAAFAVQLALNALWSLIFFGAQNLGGGLIEIIILWFAILATIILFARISRPAALLLLPYLAWVSFATYLTFALWQLN